MADDKGGVSNGYSKQFIELVVRKSGVQNECTTGHKTKLVLPYLHYEMFDVQGTRKMAPTLMKLFHWTSWYFPFHWPDPVSRLSAFALAFKLDVHPRLYWSRPFAYPVTLDMETNYVKKTSKRLTASMTERGNPRPLAIATWVEINVDPVTKLPTPFPSSWKEKHGFPKEGVTLAIQPATKPTTGVITANRKIHFLDLDSNNHPSFTVYITFCLDAFYENVLNGKYVNGNKRLLNGWLKSMTVNFKSDSSLGDVLAIESWEDTMRVNTFHFEVSLDGRVVVLVTFVFNTSLVPIESSNL